MAHFREHNKGCRAEVVINGRRASKVFASKMEAKRWAAAKETEFANKRKPSSSHTLRDTFERYVIEKSVDKKGARWEKIRLLAFEKSMTFIDQTLDQIDQDDLSKWRDERLKGVSRSSVARDFGLLKSVLNTARKEWRWMEADPFEGVVMPTPNKARTRRVKPHEVRAICRALTYNSKAPTTHSQEVALAFLIGLRTAMRAGEILGLQRADVDLDSRVAQLRDTKNGYDRAVPLSRPALRLMRLACEGKKSALFTLGPASRDALFRRAKQRTGLKDLNFHDSRAEALTRMARKVDVLTLAKISGHRDVNILLDHYYREDASSIAARL